MKPLHDMIGRSGKNSPMFFEVRVGPFLAVAFPIRHDLEHVRQARLIFRRQRLAIAGLHQRIEIMVVHRPMHAQLSGEMVEGRLDHASIPIRLNSGFEHGDGQRKADGG